MTGCQLIFDQEACVTPYEAHHVCICNGGQLLAFWAHGPGEEDNVNRLQIWNIPEMRCVCECATCCSVFRFSPDCKRIVAGGSWDEPASVWEIESGHRIWSLGSGTDGFFSDVLFSPDGTSIVIASREPNWEEIDLWCGRTGAWSRALCGGIFSLAFSANGEELAGLDEAHRYVSIVSISTGDVLLWLNLAELSSSQCGAGVLLPYCEDFCLVAVWDEEGVVARTLRIRASLKFAEPASNDITGIC